MPRSHLLLFLTLFSTSVTLPIALGQTEASLVNETTVNLDVAFGIRPVAPSRVSVPVGEKLRIIAPGVGSGITFIWTKDGQAIPGAASSPILLLDSVGTDDAGVYACLYSTPETLPKSSQQLILGVGPTERLLNLSTRGIVGAGDQSLTSGFVVAGAASKKLILRAVGPSLELFGVANPLQRPVLRIYDSRGDLFENAYVYPPVVGGLTYERDLAESMAKTGAFPLAENAGDAVEMRPFVPGTYTATVTSGDGSTGVVLLEIYEVP